jgi:hypothetical protein
MGNTSRPSCGVDRDDFHEQAIDEQVGPSGIVIALAGGAGLRVLPDAAQTAGAGGFDDAERGAGFR